MIRLLLLAACSLASSHGAEQRDTEDRPASAMPLGLGDETCGAKLESLNSCYYRMALDQICMTEKALTERRLQRVLGCNRSEPLVRCQEKCLELVGGIVQGGNDTLGGTCSIQDQQMELYSGHLNLVVQYDVNESTGLIQTTWVPSEVVDQTAPTHLGDQARCVFQDSMQYCLVDAQASLTPTFHFRAYVGLCRPAECSEQEISAHVAPLVQSAGLDDYSISCRNHYHTPPVLEWTFGQISTMILIILIVGCVVVGTVMDAWKPRPRVTTADGTSSVAGARGRPSGAQTFFNHFSLLRNYASWVKVVPEEPKAAFGALNGLRVLSTFWVILGHTAIWPLVSIQYENYGLLFPPNGKMGDFTWQAVPAGFFAVDTFFWIAGFLGARGLDAKFRKSPRLTTAKGFFLGLYPAALLGRWLRLTPLYAFVLLFSNTLFRTLGSGGLFWNSRSGCIATIESGDCSQYFWANLLYVNNIMDKIPFGPAGSGSDHCMLWSWYLACDMQMFVFLPLICFARARFGATVGWVIIAALGAVSVIYTWVIIHEKGFISDPVFSPIGFFGQVYNQTLPRCQPYLIGIGLAWLHQGLVDRTARFDTVLACASGVSLGDMAGVGMPDGSSLIEAAASPYSKRRAPGFQMWASVTLQLISFALMVSVTFGAFTRYHCDAFVDCLSPETAPWPVWLNDFYGACSHAIWAFGLSILFCLVFLKAPGTWWINWFLGSDWWQPFQKVTYATYLVHPLLVVWVYCSLDQTMAYADVTMIINFIGFGVLSFIIATVLWLFVEKPAANLAMWFLAKIGVAGSPGD